MVSHDFIPCYNYRSLHGYDTTTYVHIFCRIAPETVAQASIPQKVCQYGPSALQGRGITFLLHNFSGKHLKHTCSLYGEVNFYRYNVLTIY